MNMHIDPPRCVAFGVSIAAVLALAGCPDDGGDTGANGSDSSSGSGSSTLSTTTPPTTTSPDTTASTTDTMTMTTVDPDSSGSSTAEAGSSSSDDTGEPACPYTPVDGDPPMSLQLVASGFDRPVQVVGHPTEHDRLFVVEQAGAIRILEPGDTMAPKSAFLELNVRCGDNDTVGCEQGLYSLAFHPDFPTDPRVYVAYAPNEAGSPPTRVSEFTLSESDPDQVDPGSERIIIEAAQPEPNHNGGSMQFGPDGYLYIGLGDGGGSYDDPQTGRNPSVILSKILRIGVEPDDMPDEVVACIDNGPIVCDDLGPFDYTIPDDNPFVDNAEFAPEIFAWGFRNPWRFSFDLETGDLWVGDVGQDAWEEIDIVVAGGDYGWSAMEGNHCQADDGCDESAAPNTTNADELIAPVFEYANAGTLCSITGGGVYRSCEVPAWDGRYFYGDVCNRRVFGLSWDGTTPTDLGEIADLGELVFGNGYDAYGNVYFTTVDGVYGGPANDGLVYRVAPAP